VADDDERAGPAVEQVLERVQRVDVEVVGRLVEQDDVRLAHQQPQDLQPPALPTGQVADPGPLGVAGEAEAVRQRRGPDGLAAAEVDHLGDLLDRLQDAQRRVELGHLLRQVGRLDGLADDDPPAVRRLPADQQLEQRRLAGAVDADDADPVARPEVPVDAVEQQPLAEGQRHAVQLVDRLAEACGGEALQGDVVAGRRLVGDEGVGRVDPELRLAGARGRAAAQPGQLLLDQLQPLLLGGRGHPVPLGPGQDVRE
jgi:hypothetical protein